jgi:hypothetical protein
MIARYSRWGFLFDVSGVALQFVGRFVIDRPLQDPTLLGGLSVAFGTGLLAIGLAYDAKAKGRSLAWCLMALMGIIGVLVLALLEDRSGSTPEVGEKHEQT